MTPDEFLDEFAYIQSLSYNQLNKELALFLAIPQETRTQEHTTRIDRLRGHKLHLLMARYAKKVAEAEKKTKRAGDLGNAEDTALQFIYSTLHAATYHSTPYEYIIKVDEGIQQWSHKDIYRSTWDAFMQEVR